MKANLQNYFTIYTFVVLQILVLAQDPPITLQLQEQERRELDLSNYFNLAMNSMEINDEIQNKYKQEQSTQSGEEQFQFEYKKPFEMIEQKYNLGEIFNTNGQQTNPLIISKFRVQIGVVSQEADMVSLIIFKVMIQSDNQLNYVKYEKTFQWGQISEKYIRCIDNIRENEVIMTHSEILDTTSTLILTYFQIQQNNEIQIIQKTYVNIYILGMQIFIVDSKVFLITYDDDSQIYLYNFIVSPKTIDILLQDQFSLDNTNFSPKQHYHPLYLIISYYSQTSNNYKILVLGISKRADQKYYLRITKKQLETEIEIFYSQGWTIFLYYNLPKIYFYKTSSNLLDNLDISFNQAVSTNYPIYDGNAYIFGKLLTNQMMVQTLSNSQVTLFQIEKSRLISYFDPVFCNVYHYKIALFNRIYIVNQNDQYFELQVNIPKLIIKKGNTSQIQSGYKLSLIQPYYDNLYLQRLDINLEDPNEDLQIQQQVVTNFYYFGRSYVSVNLEEYVIGSEFKTELVNSYSSMNIRFTAQLISIGNFQPSQIIGIPKEHFIITVQVVQNKYLLIQYQDIQNIVYANIFLIIPKSDSQDYFYIQQSYNYPLKIIGRIKQIDSCGMFSTTEQSSDKSNLTTIYYFISSSEGNFLGSQVDIPCDSRSNKFSFYSDQQSNIIVQCGKTLSKYTLITNKNEKQQNYFRSILNLDHEDFSSNTSTFEIINNLLYIVTEQKLIIFDYLVNGYIKTIPLPSLNQCLQTQQIIFSKSIIYFCQINQNQATILQYGFSLDIYSNEVNYMRKMYKNGCQFNYLELIQNSFINKGKQELISVQCLKDDQQLYNLIFRINGVSSQNQLYKSFQINKNSRTFLTQNYVVSYQNDFSWFEIAQYSLHHSLNINYELISQYTSKVETLSFKINCIKDSFIKQFEFKANFQRNLNATYNKVIESSEVLKMQNLYKKSLCSQGFQTYFSDTDILTGNRLGWYSDSQVQIRGLLADNINGYQIGTAIKFVGRVFANYTENTIRFENKFSVSVQEELSNLMEDIGTLQKKEINQNSYQLTVLVYSQQYYSRFFYQYQLILSFDKTNTLIAVQFNLQSTYIRNQGYIQGNQILTVKGLGVIIKDDIFKLLKFNGNNVYDERISHLSQYFIVSIEFSFSFQLYMVFTSFGEVIYFTEYSKQFLKRIDVTQFLQKKGLNINQSTILSGVAKLPKNRFLFVYEKQYYFQIQFQLDGDELSIDDQIVVFFNEIGYEYGTLADQTDQGDKTIILVKYSAYETYVFMYIHENQESLNGQIQYLVISTRSKIKQYPKLGSSMFFIDNKQVYALFNFQVSYSITLLDLYASYYLNAPQFTNPSQNQFQMYPNQYYENVYIRGCYYPYSPESGSSQILNEKYQIIYYLIIYQIFIYFV